MLVSRSKYVQGAASERVVFPYPLMFRAGFESEIMKVKKLEFYGYKSGLKGCKWSSLNAPGTESNLSHSILKLGEFPFPIIGPLG